MAICTIVLALAGAAPGFPRLESFPEPALAVDLSPLMQAAEHQFELGNYGSSIATLKSVVSQNPTNAEAYFWLARAYYEMRDFDNAITQAEKAVALEVKN